MTATDSPVYPLRTGLPLWQSSVQSIAGEDLLCSGLPSWQSSVQSIATGRASFISGRWTSLSGGGNPGFAAPVD